jgi:hypothetical protein
MLDKFFSRKPKDGIYLGRQPLPKQVRKQLLAQFDDLRNIDTSMWTCEEHHSDRRDTKTEIAIYDENNVMTYHGRSFDKVNMSFWKANETG